MKTKWPFPCICFVQGCVCVGGTSHRHRTVPEQMHVVELDHHQWSERIIPWWSDGLPATGSDAKRIKTNRSREGSDQFAAGFTCQPGWLQHDSRLRPAGVASSWHRPSRTPRPGHNKGKYPPSCWMPLVELSDITHGPSSCGFGLVNGEGMDLGGQRWSSWRVAITVAASPQCVPTGFPGLSSPPHDVESHFHEQEQ
jgi:hypothetical protein